MSEPSEHDWPAISAKISNHGDRDAFAIYYQAFFDTMYVTVRRATGLDESTCLDIVQDAMLKVIQKMKRLNSYDHAAAWTRAVAKNAAYDFLRKQHRRQQHEGPAIEDLDFHHPSSKMSSSDHTMESTARLLWIEEQLQNLPADLRTMIDLKYRLGWTLKRIGTRFGMKTGAVDGKIRRAVERLKTSAFNENENE